MREGMAIAGAGVVALICCASIPLIVGITGLTAAAAFGVGVGILGVAAALLLALSVLRSRRRR